MNDYLDRLRLARRSEKTIALYDHTLRSFAGFLGVDAEDLHNHLDPDNLIRYAASRQEDLSDRSLKVRLGIRYSLQTTRTERISHNERGTAWGKLCGNLKEGREGMAGHGIRIKRVINKGGWE